MKTNAQKSNWLLDALLFTAFIVLFALDLTGLSLHQWLGLFSGLFAAYHLLLHWDWVTAVAARFFGKTSGQARAYLLLDGALMLGFFLIVASGLVISTWFNLNLANYTAWADFHELASYATLALLVLKIGLHWRWIVRIARQHIFAPQPQPAPILRATPALKPVPATTATPVTRRDFLKLMGIVGMASVLAFSSALHGDEETSNAAGSSTAATNTSTAQAAGATTSSACTGRCNKNKHCSFPGDCRRYQDTNSNGLCDLGECA